jgi:hypothetical protein
VNVCAVNIDSLLTRYPKMRQRIKNLESNVGRVNYLHISLLDDHASVIHSDPPRIYKLSNTGLLFHKDDSFVQLVMGPYGSGKSTMCINKIVQKACAMPAWSNGRRKSRWVVVRNTSGELYSTTLQTWLAWFSELGSIEKRQKPLLTYEHTFNDGHGLIELELLFIALDREDDVRKIKSLEATGVYINELSEVPQAALSHFKGRVNHRYPSKSFCDEYYWSGIICDTNPPDEDHWIYRDFELQNLESYKIFKQPPGLIKDEYGNWLRNPHADNAENLARDYYNKLAEGQSQDFIKVFCLGQYGIVGFGKVVYPEYNADFHSAEDVPAIQGEPIHLGWDGGLTPACIVTQISPRGQLMVLKEYLGENMGVKAFAENIVLPSLKRDFPYCPLIGFSDADPSGTRRDEIMAEFSFIGELNALGITTEAASTNKIEPRINSVRYFLNKAIDGKPGLILSRKGCPVLHKGFVKGYVFKRIAISGEERYKSEPDKNEFSHPHDGLQYTALRFASNNVNMEKKIDNNAVHNPVFQWQR